METTATINRSQDTEILKKADSPSGKAQILFLGDMMFDRYIREVIDKKGVSYIFSNLDAELKENDLNVANLEGPVAERQSVSVGTKEDQPQHFTFVFDPEIVTALKTRKFLVNLGNNHIMNFGESGLKETKDGLEANKVHYFGEPDEKNYHIAEVNGIKIGFVGYNRFISPDAQKTADQISTLKKEVSLVVVYTHWGQEYKKTPNDNQISLGHAFVDAGADVIIGSHPHVIQPIEQYKGKYIFYSLGNFVFDQFFSENTMRGLGVRLAFNGETRQIVFSLVPNKINKSGELLPMDEKERSDLLNDLADSAIADPGIKEKIKSGLID